MSFIRSQRDTWTTSGVPRSGGDPSRTTSARCRTRASGSTPSTSTSPAAPRRASTSCGPSSWFLGVKGSIEGGIARSFAGSIQSGANEARENTCATAGSTYGRTNAQARSVHSFVPS